MAQDLRKLFKEDRKTANKEYTLKSGHKSRFLNRLDKELPLEKKKNHFPWLKIAASVAILLAAAVFYFNKEVNNDPIKTTSVNVNNAESSPISLGDLSPDLKKVEAYYVANINLQLSQLEVSQENKDMADGFMDQLADLNTEYNQLNNELNALGPNDQTISALIKNLQLRLQLLHKLKTKLNELKSSKNEQVKTI